MYEIFCMSLVTCLTLWILVLESVGGSCSLLISLKKKGPKLLSIVNAQSGNHVAECTNHILHIFYLGSFYFISLDVLAIVGHFLFIQFFGSYCFATVNPTRSVYTVIFKSAL